MKATGTGKMVDYSEASSTRGNLRMTIASDNTQSPPTQTYSWYREEPDGSETLLGRRIFEMNRRLWKKYGALTPSVAQALGEPVYTVTSEEGKVPPRPTGKPVDPEWWSRIYDE